MIYSSSLANEYGSLILDTSVLINLHASTYGVRILSAIPNKKLVPTAVASELEHETARTNGDHTFLNELVASGLVGLVGLDEGEKELFESLVGGRESLGDGEAATISVASRRNFRPVIDERRGRSQALSLCNSGSPGWSLDLFRHPSVITALGVTDAAEALYFSLRDGRMRIHDSHCEHVVSILGEKRALDCNCLPGYKVRHREWSLKLEEDDRLFKLGQ